MLDFKLSRLDEWNRQRNELAQLYRRRLEGNPGIILPALGSESIVQNYHLFVVRLTTADRDLVLQKLKDKNIFAGIHYPTPIHRQKVYAGRNFAAAKFPVADIRARQIVSLPMFPEMTAEEVIYVCESLLQIIAE